MQLQKRIETYETIALALLPIFEQEPNNWEAVTFLGRRRADLKDQKLTFEEALAEWRLACPERHWLLVERIAAGFGVAIRPAPVVVLHPVGS